MNNFLTWLRQPRRSTVAVVSRVAREFLADRCMDIAAGLTYFAVLALVPALAAVISILGLIGDAERVVDGALDILREVATPDVIAMVEPILRNVTASTSSGWALAVGIAVSLWSASAFVMAFGRAMNRVYGVQEGRPVWVLRPLMYTLTLVLMLGGALAMVLFAISTDLAASIGAFAGLSTELVSVWSALRWPLALLLMIVIVALLYHWTPNVKHSQMRWLSAGAVVTICGSLVATQGFSWYVSTFGSFDQTYGVLATFVVFLLWLWICSSILLFGAELDAELTRGRQLRAGILADDELRVELRSVAGINARQAARDRDTQANAAFRLECARANDGA